VSLRLRDAEGVWEKYVYAGLGTVVVMSEGEKKVES